MTAVVALVLGSVVAGTVSAPIASATTPGTPGVTQAGTPIFTESFSNQSAAAAPISILNYTGGAAALNETYTADAPSGGNPGWVPSGNQPTSACNGCILQASTPPPPSTLDPQCLLPSGAAAWSRLQALAGVLGTAQGLGSTNQVLSAYTNGDQGSGISGYVQNPGVQFKTTNSTIPVIAGHYYAASAWYAAINCGVSPLEQFALLSVGGSSTPFDLGPQIDVCTAPGGVNYSSSAGTVRAVNIISTAFKMPAGTSNVGLQLSNLNQNTASQGAGYGNDGAFDTPTLIDVTPQLDKSFSPTFIAPGQTSTVTLTMNRPGESGDFEPWEGWSHAREHVEEVPA